MKKAIVIIVLLALLFPFLAKPAQAFYTPNASYPFQFWNAVFQTEEMNLQSFVYETFKATVMSVATPLIGCLNCPGGTHKKVWLGGAIGTVGQFTAMLYTSPHVSSVDYLAHLGKKLDLVPSAYAQGGEGYLKMEALIDLWKAFRDISYVFLVVVIVFMGFAIMFRVKTSPQAIITIQSALPKIVLTLLLITFSYAIVGLLIDLMLVFSNLVISIFNRMLNLDFLELLPKGLPLVPPVTGESQLAGTLMAVAAVPMVIFILLLLIIMAIPTLIAAVATAGVGALGALAIFVIVVIVLFVILLKIFWTILKAKVNVILALIFGPIQILFGALPGNQATSSWFKNLIANLAVFPVVLTMVYLSAYLSLWAVIHSLELSISQFIPFIKFAGGDIESGIRAISDLLSGRPPEEIATTISLFFVSMGILALAPKAADMIKAFFAGQPFGYGAAMGAALGPLGTARGIGQPAAIQWGGEYAVGKAASLAPPASGAPASPGYGRWRWIERALRGMGYRGP